ncbi:MAG: MFS transporter [Chloroflexi bacterium]|nr:MFS transporter [Chloroflexota bacterium]
MRLVGVFPRLNRDGKLVIAASSVRALDYSFLSIFLGVYLTFLEFSAIQAGMVISGIMAGGALSNLVATWRGDAIGRKRMLVGMSALMVLGGILLPLNGSVAFLVVIGLFAMTTATGGDRTAFVSMDTAILTETTDGAQRTLVFSWYNLIAFLGRAIGALLIAGPAVLQSRLDIGEQLSFQIMFGVYAVIAVGGIVLYSRLSPQAEALPKDRKSPTRSFENDESRKLILKMAGLFSLDAMGGGFIIRSFISFWFVNHFGVDLYSIAGIFFAGQMLNAISVSLATPVANRIGLINTMASSQALSNMFVILMALSGQLWVAVFFFLVHELCNEMDIPTRQSYTMAIVAPESRTAMASLSNLGRNIAQTISPSIAGVIAQVTFLGAPLLLGAGTKLLYNALLYAMFRSYKTPEELVSEAKTEMQGEEADG